MKWWKKKEQPIELTEVKPICSIKFSFMPDDNLPNIEAEWSNTSPETATLYGSLLYEINNGLYTADVLEILQEYAQQKPSDAMFIGSVIKTWKTLIEIVQVKKSEKHAVVHPLRTFGASKIFGAMNG